MLARSIANIWVVNNTEEAWTWMIYYLSPLRLLFSLFSLVYYVNLTQKYSPFLRQLCYQSSCALFLLTGSIHFS